jgi:hypothetical protein
LAECIFLENWVLILDKASFNLHFSSTTPGFQACCLKCGTQEKTWNRQTSRRQIFTSGQRILAKGEEASVQPREVAKMPKRKKLKGSVIIGAVLIALALGFVLETQYHLFTLLIKASSTEQMNLLGGLEGAKCLLVGATPYGWTGCAGNNIYSQVQGGTQFIEHSWMTAWDHVYWANYQPSNQLVYWDRHLIGEMLGRNQRSRILIETQLDVPLENLNKMGDPLDWNSQQYFEILQYEPNATSSSGDVNRQLSSVDLPDGTRQYTLTKRSILIVPAELHIALSISPSTEGSDLRDSGWEEANPPWAGIQYWFQLDFTTWAQQASPWNSRDLAPEADASYFQANPASSTAQFVTYGDYSEGGGFPVSAWISGFVVNTPRSGVDIYDAKVFTVTPDLYQLPGSGDPNFDNVVQTYPSLIGHSVPLYSEPGETGLPDAEPSYVGRDAILAQAKTYPWAGNNQAPAYFSISADTFGTYAYQVNPPFGGWTVKYPAVNYRVRVLFAVWGTFTYLWTVKTAADNGYTGWWDRSSQTIVTRTWWDDLVALFQNPLFLMILFLFVIIIIFCLIAVFAPWALPELFSGAKQARDFAYESVEKRPSWKKKRR